MQSGEITFDPFAGEGNATEVIALDECPIRRVCGAVSLIGAGLLPVPIGQTASYSHLTNAQLELPLSGPKPGCFAATAPASRRTASGRAGAPSSGAESVRRVTAAGRLLSSSKWGHWPTQDLVFGG